MPGWLWAIIGIVAGVLLVAAAIVAFFIWLSLKEAYPDRHEVTGEAPRSGLAGGLGRLRRCLTTHHGQHP